MPAVDAVRAEAPSPAMGVAPAMPAAPFHVPATAPIPGDAPDPVPADVASAARAASERDDRLPYPPAATGANGDTSAHAAASGCTAPQLRRFIKSRAWVPMHELRRRFGINGTEDDVTPVAVDGTTIFVGLPSREGQLLGELLRAGDIGYELSMDPFTPVVIGVYPMRPVPRH